MKVFAVVSVFVVGLVALAQANVDPQVCYVGVNQFCEGGDPTKKSDVDCRAITPQFGHSSKHLFDLANLQLEVSYKYMLLAAQFKSYLKDRPGFEAKIKSLSDRSWQMGQDLIKYVTKRGGHFKFEAPNVWPEGMADMTEFQAMATVLDTEKFLFEKARITHEGASHAKEKTKYDPEIAHFIEEKILTELAGTIRQFSGYANDLKNLYAGSNDINMDNYLFDQYLQKA